MTYVKDSLFAWLCFAFLSYAQASDASNVLVLSDKLAVAYEKTSYSDELNEEGQLMVPRGAAVLTGAGDLENTGIRFVVHAAAGAMTKSGGIFEPTLSSVEASVINSIKVAESFGVKKIAIPFIASGIFLQRMQTTKQFLAAAIIKAAKSTNTNMEVVFVTWETEDTTIFSNLIFPKKNPPSKGWFESTVSWISSWWRSPAPSKDDQATEAFSKISLVRGSITDFNVHGADAIVNAANMEVIFGGGISGRIGDATNAAEEINESAQMAIQSYINTQVNAQK